MESDQLTAFEQEMLEQAREQTKTLHGLWNYAFAWTAAALIGVIVLLVKINGG